MINTVFYFPSSIDEYNAAIVDPKTICFVPNANGNGSIYKGGKKFGGADISDVITAIQQYMELHPAHDYSADIESLQNNVVAMSATLRALSSISPEGIKNTFLRGFDTYKKMIQAFEATGDTTWQEYTLGREDLNEWASEMGIISPQGNGYYQVGWSRLSQNVNEIRATVTQIGHTVRNLADNPASGEVDIEQLSADLYAYIHENAADAGISSTWGKYVARDEEDIQLLESMASTVQTYADNNVTFASLLSAANDYRTGQGSIAGIISRVGTVESDIEGINDQLDGIGDVIDGKITTAMVGMVVTDDLNDYVPRASVIAAINESGESNVTIDADKINIGGIQIQSSQVSGINQLIADTILATDIQAAKVRCLFEDDNASVFHGGVGFLGIVRRKTQVDNSGLFIEHTEAVNGENEGEYTTPNKHVLSITDKGIRYDTYQAVDDVASFDADGNLQYNSQISSSGSWTIEDGRTGLDINSSNRVNIWNSLSPRLGITFDVTSGLSATTHTYGLIGLADYTVEDPVMGDVTQTMLEMSSENKIKLTAPTIESGNVNVSNGTYSTEYAVDGITSTTEFSISSGINQTVMIPSPLTLGGNVRMTGSGKLTINTTGDIELGSPLHGEPDIYIYATPTGGSTPAKYKLDLQKLIQDGYLVAV